jgi:flagellar basal body P-ring protein FlgI
VFEHVIAYTGSAASGDGAKNRVTVDANGVYSYTILEQNDAEEVDGKTVYVNKATDSTAYIRIDGIAINGVAEEKIVINVKRGDTWV